MNGWTCNPVGGYGLVTAVAAVLLVVMMLTNPQMRHLGAKTAVNIPGSRKTKRQLNLQFVRNRKRVVSWVARVGDILFSFKPSKNQ